MINLMSHWLVVAEDIEQETYHVGQVIDQSEGYIMMATRPAVGPSFNKLYSMETLECGNHFIFKTEQALNEWIEWATKPRDAQNVVTLKRKE